MVYLYLIVKNKLRTWIKTVMRYDIIRITNFEFKDTEKLLSWRNNFLEELVKKISSEHKRILEIGCGDGKIGLKLSNLFPEKQICGIDLNSGYRINNFIKYRMNAEELFFHSNSIDFVYSQNSFEHITDVKKAFNEVVRVLRPGGSFYTSFAPIWTHSFGHHWYHETEKSFDDFGIPPYAHLFMSKSKLKKLIIKNAGRFTKKRFQGEQFIFGDCCNKMFPNDYRNIFLKHSKFTIDKFEEIRNHHHNRKKPAQLLKKYPLIHPDDFDICGFKIYGYKIK